MSPDRWLVLSVRVPSAELNSELTEGLLALGGSAVEEDGERLTTFLPDPDLEVVLAAAESRLGSITGSRPRLEWRWQDDEDWTARWKEGLSPRPVGQRLIVTQPWNAVAERGDRAVIVIDPATAFGTGEHATTRGALRLVEGAIEDGDRVLDLGAGSGILSIAAVRLGADRARAVDSDAAALGSARENVARNGVADRVELERAVVDDRYLRARAGEGFDLVVANILGSVLTPLLPGLSAVAAPDGRVILGGVLDTEAAGVVEAAGTAGLVLRTEEREGEWWTGLFGSAGAPR